ncbi:uncharacterized protein ACA1_175460 [Acanthamoeba castellanii str. Neff]|uniref:Uncharacterized protein n=1 Tax=Acanthamoeba castellanii (strain ATCC 30010 / Neff) TaxID=1257118 RepID=L8HKD5_ACACF|nr:uncharacterized protein ACA1_175460 [Acanthamoeba castellanii str. Neff]ELR24871.1 hypothetical protein ACA1_175460 [Acanthamoeba castellanii str. Neff]
MSLRASRLSVGANIALLGIVGRKTGIAPKANVLKDADDMDNVDDWFASSDEEEARDLAEMEEEVEEEVEVEEEAEMEESEIGEQEPSFAIASPARRGGGALSILDQSFMQNVTPIRRVSSRADVTFAEQDSLPWVSPPNLSPTRASESTAAKSRAGGEKRRSTVTANVATTAAAAAAQPSSIRSGSVVNARAKPTPPSPPPPVDDGNDDQLDTSGYSSVPESVAMTTSKPAMASTADQTATSTIKSGRKGKKSAARTTSAKPRREATVIADDDSSVSGHASVAAASDQSAWAVSSVSSSGVDSVRLPPTPKVMIMDESSRPRARRKKRGRDLTEERSDDDEKEERSEDEDEEDSAKPRSKGKAAKQSTKALSKKQEKRKRDEEEDDEEEEKQQKKKKKENESKQRRRTEEEEEDDVSGGEDEADVQYARNAKGRKGAASARTAAAAPTKSAAASAKDTGKRKAAATRSPPPKASKKRRLEDDDEEEEEEDDEEERRRESKRRGKQKATTPSPPASPARADDVSFGGADVSGFTEPDHSLGAADVRSVSMEMASPETSHSDDGGGGGGYETHIPLKDAAPSSPVGQRYLSETSMNDLTVYEELPTFVDPNDVTWAANDSLIEETEANRQAPTRRSKRKKVTPLAYWKNERVVYGFKEGDRMRSVKDVVRITSPEVPWRAHADGVMRSRLVFILWAPDATSTKERMVGEHVRPRAPRASSTSGAAEA